jgi:hypothetical protein
MRKFILFLVTSLTATIFAGGLTPATAAFCSFTACLNKCNAMPDDKTAQGPKWHCLSGCNGCVNPVTGPTNATMGSPDSKNKIRRTPNAVNPALSNPSLLGTSGGPASTAGSKAKLPASGTNTLGR